MGRLWKRSMSSLTSSWLIGEQLEAFLTLPPDWNGIRTWLDPIAVPLVPAVKLNFFRSREAPSLASLGYCSPKGLTSDRLKVSYQQFHLAWHHVIMERHIRIISVDNCSLICSSYAGFAGTKGSGSSLTHWLMMQIGDICPIIYLTGRLKASMLAMLQLWSNTHLKDIQFARKRHWTKRRV